MFSKQEKRSAFIDVAVDHAFQTPTVCYKDVSSLVNDTVKPKIFKYKFVPAKGGPDTSIRPKKTNEVDVGSYNPLPSFEYVQDRTGPSQKWLTGKRESVVDPEVRRTKGNPNPAHYKVKMEAYDRLSKSPPSIRTKRH